ncbi:MAG: DUF5317 domain-containing protein [Chloroflexales bacterium]|nr:DUF5317 domain-containing protein [Chloroflexales bacterium]
MLVLPITLGVILFICTCCFGRAGWRRLASLELHRGRLVVLAGLAQLVHVFTGQSRFFLLILTIISLGIFGWLNRQLPGIWLVALGIALNFAVMGANQGAMPISPTTLAHMSADQVEVGSALPLSKNTVLDDKTAALPWLGDRLVMPGPFGSAVAWSIGDLALIGGVSRLLWVTMGRTRLNHHPKVGA